MAEHQSFSDFVLQLGTHGSSASRMLFWENPTPCWQALSL
jgi:hypothetical protein